MSAFCLFDNIEVHDADRLAQYVQNVAPVVARYGGIYRVVGGSTTVLEGEWSPRYPVIIEFPSLEQAKTWYDSADYEPMKKLRQSAVTCNGILIEGL